MKNKFALLLGAVLVLATGQRGFSADAASDFKTLATKIRADVAAGKRTEPELADDLKQIDALLDKYKAEKTDDVAIILFNKAMMYQQLFKNPAKGKALMNQLFTDYKETPFVINLKKEQDAAAPAKKINDALVVGSQFPDFDEQDLAGKPLSLASRKGKVVLVDFWATWCPPCRAELPNVIAAYDKYHPQGFDIIGISLDESKEKLVQFTETMKMPWPQYFDGLGWGNKLAGQYGVRSIPATFLVDGSGKIIARDLRGEELEKALSVALAKEQPVTGASLK